jgi:hypothetical protein
VAARKRNVNGTFCGYRPPTVTPTLRPREQTSGPASGRQPAAWGRLMVRHDSRSVRPVAGGDQPMLSARVAGASFRQLGHTMTAPC